MSPPSTDLALLPEASSASMEALVSMALTLPKAPTSTAEPESVDYLIGRARRLEWHADVVWAALNPHNPMTIVTFGTNLPAPLEACAHQTLEVSTIEPRPNSPLVEAVIRTDEILHLAGELYADSRPASREERIAAYSALRRAGRPTRR